ncbi:MAG: hypothetical protein ACRYGG_07360, partial [Janthinobacterium lividum]
VNGSEQKFCFGIIVDEMDGKCIMGLVVDPGEGVMLLFGTWWTTFGPDECTCKVRLEEKMKDQDDITFMYIEFAVEYCFYHNYHIEELQFECQAWELGLERGKGHWHYQGALVSKVGTCAKYLIENQSRENDIRPCRHHSAPDR